MYSSSIDPILQKTAETLNLPLEEVTAVMKHTFSTLKKELRYPSYPLYRLEEFGNFSITPYRLAQAFSRTLKKYREEPTPTLRKRLEYMARVRQYVSARRQQSKYKKRFGSWHWKPQ